jgi:hypothetical protein
MAFKCYLYSVPSRASFNGTAGLSPNSIHIVLDRQDPHETSILSFKEAGWCLAKYLSYGYHE